MEPACGLFSVTVGFHQSPLKGLTCSDSGQGNRVVFLSSRRQRLATVTAFRFIPLRFLFLLALLQGCSSIPQYPIQAHYLGEPINTTVDSPLAAYYLSAYLPDQRDVGEFDATIEQLYRQYPEFPDREVLRQIAAQTSTDFAAVFFSEQLMQDPANQKIQQHFQSLLRLPSDQLHAPRAEYANYLVVFVPGWNYEANGSLTGSDLATPRQLVSELGIENYLVKTPSNGSVEASADELQKDLQFYSAQGKRLIVVGASAAGPAIHLTLGERLPHKQQDSIYGWINLGGILQGSPLVDYFDQWPQKLLSKGVHWYKGWDEDDTWSMSAEVSRERFTRLRLKPDLITLNYLALSLSGNLSSLSRNKYPLFVDEGPNDGLTLLSDVIAPNSLTLISVNSDHYFGQDPRINDKTVAVLRAVIDLIEARDPSGPYGQ